MSKAKISKKKRNRRVPRDFFTHGAAREMHPVNFADGFKAICFEYPACLSVLFSNCEELWIMKSTQEKMTLDTWKSLLMDARLKFQHEEFWDIEKWFHELGYRKTSKGW